MKNILHIIESSETGGAETIFFELVYNINSEFKNFVGLFEEGWLYDKLISNNCHATIFKTSGSIDLALVKNMVNFVYAHKINLIHSHLFGATVYSTIVAKICNIPSICTLHGAVDLSAREKYGRLKIWLINLLSNKIIYVSKHLRRHFENKGFKKSKGEVIYNGITSENFSSYGGGKLKEELGLPQDTILIGSVGDLRKAKSYETLIVAAKILHEKGIQCTFVVAGSFTNRWKYYHSMLRKYNLINTFKFIGFRADIPNILSSLDIFVLSSSTEGFSLSTVEAMATGKPIIATRCGGPEELITNQRNGLLVDVNSPGQIADAIEKLLQNRLFADAISREAKISIKDQFEMKVMVNNYKRLYEQLLYI